MLASLKTEPPPPAPEGTHQDRAGPTTTPLVIGDLFPVVGLGGGEGVIEFFEAEGPQLKTAALLAGETFKMKGQNPHFDGNGGPIGPVTLRVAQERVIL